jgi:hypothetical protein
LELVWKKNKKIAYVFTTFIFCATFWWFPRIYDPVKAPWNKMAEQIAQFPQSTVVTTRTKALATPYFDEKNIVVHELYLTDEGFNDLLKLFEYYENVWIIENYWGTIGYWSSLEEKLKNSGLKMEVYPFQTEKSEVIMAMRVHH